MRWLSSPAKILTAEARGWHEAPVLHGDDVVGHEAGGVRLDRAVSELGAVGVGEAVASFLDPLDEVLDGLVLGDGSADGRALVVERGRAHVPAAVLLAEEVFADADVVEEDFVEGGSAGHGDEGAHFDAGVFMSRRK